MELSIFRFDSVNQQIYCEYPATCHTHQIHEKIISSNHHYIAMTFLFYLLIITSLDWYYLLLRYLQILLSNEKQNEIRLNFQYLDDLVCLREQKTLLHIVSLKCLPFRALLLPEVVGFLNCAMMILMGLMVLEVFLEKKEAFYELILVEHFCF